LRCQKVLDLQFEQFQPGGIQNISVNKHYKYGGR
jgi:hypothetical protein